MCRRIVSAWAVALALVYPASALAMNGFSVTSASRNGWGPENNGNPSPGKIVRIDITGNAESGRATIYDGLAYYPTISFDGTRVVFLRLDAKLNAAGTALVGRFDTGYVSIVNKDGTGLRDLVKLYCGQYGWGARYADCQGHFTAWPAGNWVYYEKPPKTGEFWRVNVNDPSLHHMVVRYHDGGVRPANCACDVNGSEGFWLRRWQLSADAKYCGGMFKVYPDGPQQLPHRFPPPEGYAPLSMPIYPDFPACNLCLSASGEYMSAYFAGCHDFSPINRWDHATNVGPRYQSVANSTVGLYTDIRTWCGRDVGNLGDYMRWAANSDKWLLIEASYGCGGGTTGSNQVMANWKDRAGMSFTGVSSGGSMNHESGSLWISDPTNNPNGDKYETPAGTWVAVTPRDIYLTWTITGTSPSQVSIAAYPTNAEIRYTTDGADPTQSSNLYSAQLNITPAAGRATQIKARAFRTGMSPAETESRILVPSTNALPAGYLKQLLCLETAQGGMAVPFADTAAVMTKYTGENGAVPWDGDQVVVNGHTYTWRFRSDSDGVWSPATGGNSLEFWYTTIVSPVSRTVKLGARFHGNPRMYLNGTSQWFFDGWDSNHEWQFGNNDGASIGLLKGVNGVLMVQHADGVFGVRFLNRSNDGDLTDLQYFPHSATSVDRPAATRAGHSSACVTTLAGDLLILPGTAHAAFISNIDGRMERTVRGLNGVACRVPLTHLGKGMHLVTLVSNTDEQTWRVLVR